MSLELTSHEQRLYDRLREEHRKIYVDLRSNIEEYLLDFVAMNIRYFTSHGKRHSLGVIQQIDNLLPDDVLQGLSSTEALVLLCAAWLHDIGLLVNRDQTGKMLEYDEIRDQHPELGREIIMDTHDEAGIKDHNLAFLIAEICYCHSRKAGDIQKYFLHSSEQYEHDSVRSRFLAALLRLADGLDIGENRAPNQMIRKISEFPPDARLHWDICRIMEVGYNQENGAIVISAIARKDQFQTADDYRRLFFFKFADLSDEFIGVREILRDNGVPYTILEGHLTYNPGNGNERREETVLDNDIPVNEVFPLEVILYEQMKREHVKQKQHLFAADWDYQAARLYEEEASKPDKNTGVRSRYDVALQRAELHYTRACELVRQEIPLQPSGRFFLRTLEAFFALKARQCSGEALARGEILFLSHMNQANKALDRLEKHQAFIESSPMVLPPFMQAGRSPLRPALQRAFEAYRSLLNRSKDKSFHHGCCLCTAQLIFGFALAGFNEEVKLSTSWLREQAESHWRSINSLESPRPVEMGHEYTASALRAFLEMGDREEACHVATYLLSEKTEWEDWAQIHSENVMSDGLDLDGVIQQLHYFLSQCPDLIPGGISRFETKQRIHIERIYQDLSGGHKHQQPAYILGQLLWDRHPDATLRQEIKAFVCRNIQNAHEHPVWAEDGSWGYNPYTTRAYVLQALNFWEYYLVGKGTFEEFEEFAHPGEGWLRR